jgi:hypothetical protein
MEQIETLMRSVGTTVERDGMGVDEEVVICSKV